MTSRNATLCMKLRVERLHRIRVIRCATDVVGEVVECGVSPCRESAGPDSGGCLCSEAVRDDGLRGRFPGAEPYSSGRRFSRRLLRSPIPADADPWDDTTGTL